MTGNGRTRVRLTARGAIVLLFAITLLGQITWPGPGFVAGCLAAALLVQPRDLLPLVVTPPLVFFSAVLVVEVVASLGATSPVQALGVGLFTALSSGAPWLFGGTALVLAVAWPRGLPNNVRDLRRDLASAASPASGNRSRVFRRSPRATFVPEPEGYFEPRVYGRPADD